MKKRPFMVLISALLIFFFSVDAFAGWVQDWISNHTVTAAPDSLLGQKRNYYTLGGVSARWQATSDSLISFSFPKLKFGCGGIDAFLGGFSFLNLDYLVQKFQQILQAAPAAAFDIALNNLCEPCAKAIKSLEAISDYLNSIQLDTCKATRALAVELLYPLDPHNLGAKKAEADATLQIFSGANDMWDKVTKIWERKDDKPATPNLTSTALSGCGAIQYLLRSGSVIQKLMDAKGMGNYASLVRGLFGDVVINPISGGDVAVQELAGCNQNDPTRIDDFISGKIWVKHYTGLESPCQKLADKPLYNYVNEKVTSIYNKIKNKSALTTEEESFVLSSGMPVLPIIRSIVATGGDSPALVSVSEVLARQYAYWIISDLYSALFNSIMQLDELYTKEKYDKQYCNLELVKPVIDAIRDYAKRIREFSLLLRTDLVKHTTEINSLMAYANYYRQMDEEFKRKVWQTFGSSGMRGL